MDKISGERLLFGLATGDRPIEFTTFGVNRDKRAELYREALYVMKETWANPYPIINSSRVRLNGETDILPKPALRDIPTFITGFSGQSLEWIAEKGDGWISYPRHPNEQGRMISDWRSLTREFKPFTQSLYIDLLENPHAEPVPIHLGFRSGRHFLVEFLKRLEAVGVNHVILTLKFVQRPIADIIQELGEEVVPHFPAL